MCPTVYRILVRHDRNRLHIPTPPEVRRYEKTRPGELVHLDVKFLPALRNARWDFEFGAVDDFTREAVARIATEQTARTAVEFLRRVLAALPYRIEAVLTDNAWVFTMQKAFHQGRETPFAALCRDAEIQHRILRPYRPQSNGKGRNGFFEPSTMSASIVDSSRPFTGACARSIGLSI